MEDDNARNEEVKMASVGEPEVGDVKEGDTRDEEKVEMASIGEPEVGDVKEGGTRDEEKVETASIGEPEVADVKEGEEVTRIPLKEDHADEERDTEEGSPPLQEGATRRPPGHFRLYYVLLLVGALAAAVVALSVALVVVVLDDEDATVLPSVDEQSADDRLVEGGNGLAQVPVALVDFLADVVALPEGVDRRRRLAIPPDMLEKLNGKCATFDEYTPSKNTQEWQCAQRKNSPNYPLELDAQKGTPFKPSDSVLNLLAEATGASLSSLQRMLIGSGQPLAPEGSWCGMPAPGADDLDTDTLSPQDELAYNYWRKCVSPRAGYFNVLQCGGQCDEEEENCSTYAVLGYAAMDASVCYPAHQHRNEEAYWQIAGHGWWRTWNNVSGLDNYTTASNDNFGGSKYGFHPHRADLPHEFDTTNNLDNDRGAGTLEEPMVMVYWWGVDNAIDINYKWSSQVRDDPFAYEASAHSCGDFRRIPVYNENLTQTITSLNC